MILSDIICRLELETELSNCHSHSHGLEHCQQEIPIRLVYMTVCSLSYVVSGRPAHHLELYGMSLCGTSMGLRLSAAARGLFECDTGSLSILSNDILGKLMTRISP